MTLGARLVLVVAIESLAIFGVASVLLIRSQHGTLIAQMKEQGDDLSETIKSSTRHAMLLNRPDNVHEIITAVGRQEGIDKVRVFNKEGRIIYSPDASLVDTLVDKRAEACYLCHAADSPLERLPIAERARVFEAAAGERRLGIVNPIYNEPACTEADCHAHPASQSVLGVLDLTMSLAEVDRRLVAHQWRASALLLAAVLAIGTMIWLFLHAYVGKPVAELVAATNAVAAGDLDYRLGVKRNDELGQLQRSFNEMTGKLSEAQSQLYQSEKLASLGRLAAGVAHEINNPLTGVLAYSSALLKRTPADSEARDDLATVVRETKRCREIVQGLLDFSRQKTARKQAIQLPATIDRAIDIVGNQLAVGNVEVSKRYAADLPTVRADPDQIVQVLINLLVNAADAIGPAGGQIFVSCDLAEANGESFLEVKVADTGSGIAEKHLDRIFEPFFSTKAGQGTGLGLAVVWGIVEEHGGRISVDSKNGRGTTFTVRLPAQPAAPPIASDERRA